MYAKIVNYLHRNSSEIEYDSIIDIFTLLIVD